MRSSLLLLVASPLLAACSSATPLSLIITTGQETNAFSACGAVSFTIDVTSLDDTIMLSETNVPVGGSFDFGDIDATEQVTVAVTGANAAGTVVMAGSSLAGVLLESVEGGIPVFVACVNQWSRPPGALLHSHVNGNAFVQTEEYLMLTGGSAPKGAPSTDTTEIDGYDMGVLDGVSNTAFDIVPLTAVSIGEQVLLINSTSATWVDFSTDTETDDVAWPAGNGSFADVAGGQVVVAPDNSAGYARYFVVGATRVGSPTASVLEVDGDETLTAYTLSEARAGAAAAWIDNVGLVVTGGNATGVGVEVLADGATAFAPRSFASDDVVGAGGVFDGTSGMLLFGGLNDGRRPGGEAPNSTPQRTRWLESLTCDQTGTEPPCEPSTKGAPALPAWLTNVSAYGVGGGNTIVVGSEVAPPFLDRTFYVSLSAGKVVEMPLREPRSGATPLPTPVGSLAMLGGQHPDGSPALNVELLFPTTTLP